jgi:hypothetical protein
VEPLRVSSYLLSPVDLIIIYHGLPTVDIDMVLNPGHSIYDSQIKKEIRIYILGSVIFWIMEWN